MKSQTAQNPALATANDGDSRPRKSANGGRPRPLAGLPIRLLLADDHPVVRQGLVACLARHPNLEIVGEAADGQAALGKARALVPDVLLTDIDMPLMTGLDLAEAVRAELPQIKILLLSAHSSPEWVLRCAQSGANGYISKEASPDEFVQAIETVHGGQSFFSANAARVALNRLVLGSGSGPDLSALSAREREVLTHIAEGLCNKEIAACLNIGTRTVETHRERLMRKLDIHSIAGLTKFAVANGLIRVPELALASA